MRTPSLAYNQPINMTQVTRYCRKCARERPIDAFGRYKGVPNAYPYCKPCHSKEVVLSRKTPRKRPKRRTPLENAFYRARQLDPIFQEFHSLDICGAYTIPLKDDKGTLTIACLATISHDGLTRCNIIFAGLNGKGYRQVNRSEDVVNMMDAEGVAIPARPQAKAHRLRPVVGSLTLDLIGADWNYLRS